MVASERSTARGVDPVAARAALARLARNDTLPWLHGEIARRLVERLAPIRLQPQRIVEWWPGPGGGDDVVRAVYPRAERVAVEPDAAWAARRRAGERTRWWSFGAARAPAVVEESASDVAIGRAQLVWANMALHLVVDPQALFARWLGLLEVEGVAVFSCLGPGTLRELRELYAASGWPMPTPGFIDMHDLGDMLVDAGFADPVLDQETIQLRWQSAEALLAELRQLGGNTHPDRHPALRTPAWRRRLLAALGERADANGSIGLAVEVAYGHGFKPPPRLRADAPVVVSLDDMRAMVRRQRPSGRGGTLKSVALSKAPSLPT
ncbi:MAG TPA: biotin synthase [Caldimonas sp.]|nr:biotin synthase [Caldimonas sp.]HEX4233548.1 biotin synthase [Caldimonas sp.]